MEAIASAERIGEALRERLGVRLSELVAQDAARALEGCAPSGEALDAAAKRVETAIFRALYRELGVSMLYLDDAGRCRRVSTDDLPELADCVMGVLFAQMPINPTSYSLLHDYALRVGSLAALCVLYRRFRAYSGEEHDLIGRVLRDRYAGNMPDWLKIPG